MEGWLARLLPKMEEERTKSFVGTFHEMFPDQYILTLINSWISMLVVRRRETADHSFRVKDIAWEISLKYNLSFEDQISLILASLLHDIGKTAISNRLLEQPRKLSRAERKIVEEHPRLTLEILSKLQNQSWLEKIVRPAALHHERFDGLGYLLGLRRQEIPLITRILMVADVFEALTSTNRNYRSKMNKHSMEKAQHEAVHQLCVEEREKFDPEVLNALLELYGQEELRKIIMLCPEPSISSECNVAEESPFLKIARCRSIS